MVRTKDSANVKVPGAKAPRKIAPAQTSTESCSDSKKKYSGGNPYCPRETPAWQKPITSFFIRKESDAGSSSSSALADNGSTVNPEADVSKTSPQKAEGAKGEARMNTKEEEGDNHEPS